MLPRLFVAALLTFALGCGGSEPSPGENAPPGSPPPRISRDRVDSDSPTDEDLARMREERNTTDLVLAVTSTLTEGTARLVFTVTNRGPNAAYVPTLRIVLPAGVPPPDPSPCRVDGEAIDCILAPLPTGQTAELAVDFVVQEGTTLFEAKIRNQLGPDREPASDAVFASVTR